MSEKIYARVVNGKIIDYPVYEYIIYGKGDSFSLYTPVDTSDKPEEDELYSKVVPMEKNNIPFYVVDFDFNEYEDSYKGSNILFSVSRPEYRYTYTTKAMIDNWLDANKVDKKEWIENFETFRIDLKQKNMDLILILNLLHEISHAYVPAIKIDDSDLHGLSKKERSVRYHCKDREKLPDVIACEMFVRHYEKIVDIISSYRN